MSVETVGAVLLVGALLVVHLLRLDGASERTRSTFANEWLVEDIRHARRVLPSSPSAVVTRGGYTRPSLVHWVVSLLPRRRLVSLRPRYGVVPLVGQVLVVTVLVAAGTINTSDGAVVALLLASTPQFSRLDRDVDERFYGYSSAVVVATLSLVSYAVWLQSGAAALVVLVVLAGGLVALMDRVVLQLWGATLALAAVVRLDATAAVAVALSVVVAVLLTRGAALRLFAAYAKLVFDDLFNDYAYLDYRLRVRGGDGGVSAGRSLLGSTVASPVVVGAAVVVLIAATAAPTGGPDPFTVLWIVVAVAWAALAALLRRPVTGPADTALEFGALPSALVVATVRPFSGLAGWLVPGVVVCLGVAVLSRSAIRSHRSETAPDSTTPWDDVVRYLSDRQPSIVLCQPSVRSLELAARTGHRVVDFLFNEEGSVDQIDALFPETYGRVTDDVPVVEYYFNPDWLVVNRQELDEGSTLVPAGTEPEFDRGPFAVFAFDDVMDAWQDGKRSNE